MTEGGDSQARPIVLNGRAAARSTISGVERWAREVIPRLLALRPERYLALRPPPRSRGRARSQAWEQFSLPLRARRLGARVIFSPANLAPWAWPGNVLVLHDAAVLRNASAYSPAYRAWHALVGIACARRALKVITVSEFSRRELIDLGGLRPDAIAVIHGGVNGRFRPDLDLEPVARKHHLSAPYVLTVATDDRRKNLGALEPTAHRLGELGLELVWAGGARPHIGHERSPDGIRRLGYVDEDDLPGLYGGARAFVLPSRYEGFGLTCLEAMACGTPVVAADRAALPEACGGAALLVDPDDPDEVAEAVIRAATDEPLRAALRRAGLARAREKTWDATALQIDALLGELA